MIYKTITKSEFRKLIEELIKENETMGPREVDRKPDGKPIYQFREVHSFDEICLDYTVTASSVKNFFLPFKEELTTYNFESGDWNQEIEYRVNPRVIVGVRPCDINALRKLDRIFLQGNYPSPYYIARRKNTFLIGMDHLPLDDCFCESLDQHSVIDGFNLFCSDIGDKYYLTVNSSKAFNFLKKVKTEVPTEEDDKKFIECKNKILKGFKSRVDVSDLPNILDIEFGAQIWKDLAKKCLHCGTCAMVCPTCYCHGVEESIATNLKTGSKTRVQYSCNLVDFALVAGGHNFRAKPEDKLKYRYYHHYRGFEENGEDIICVGCNRCGRACLADIKPAEVINNLRLEKSS